MFLRSWSFCPYSKQVSGRRGSGLKDKMRMRHIHQKMRQAVHSKKRLMQLGVFDQMWGGQSGFIPPKPEPCEMIQRFWHRPATINSNIC